MAAFAWDPTLGTISTAEQDWIRNKNAEIFHASALDILQETFGTFRAPNKEPVQGQK
jgi:hypothetical protein